MYLSWPFEGSSILLLLRFAYSLLIMLLFLFSCCFLLFLVHFDKIETSQELLKYNSKEGTTKNARRLKIWIECEQQYQNATLSQILVYFVGLLWVITLVIGLPFSDTSSHASFVNTFSYDRIIWNWVRGIKMFFFFLLFFLSARSCTLKSHHFYCDANRMGQLWLLIIHNWSPLLFSIVLYCARFVHFFFVQEKVFLLCVNVKNWTNHFWHYGIWWIILLMGDSACGLAAMLNIVLLLLITESICVLWRISSPPS